MSEPNILDQIRSNTEERLPCVIVVDTSSSMAENGAIDEVNAALKQFAIDIRNDSRTRDRAMLVIVRAGGDVELIGDWNDASNFDPPSFAAGGGTPLGEAVILALAQIERIKTLLRNEGNTLRRPWMFLLTDGEPTDENWESSAEACRQAELAKKVIMYPFGTKTANFEKLKKFSNNGALQMEGASYAEVFKFLSSSMATATDRGANKAVQVQLPPGTIQIPLD